jgi:large subunit ribosomal protein L15
MAQKNRKIHKKRGTRSCGHGNAQKHRGAGSRGGRGNAGAWTHHQKERFINGFVRGKTGFRRHPSLVSSEAVINLDDLNARIVKWAAEGKAKKTTGGYSVDLCELGYDKVLGSGKLTHKIEVKAGSFSESARKKIEAAGGKVLGDGIDSV